MKTRASVLECGSPLPPWIPRSCYGFDSEQAGLHANGVPFVSPGSSPRDPGLSCSGICAL